MCGIAGTWSADMTADERLRLVLSLMSRLADRGPDCSVIVEGDRLTLGFCRLTITGAPGRVQPVRCKHVLSVVNGEIYNYAELWQDLPLELRHADQPASDCSVVAPLAVQHGSAFVDRLDGVFAGVVVDHETGELTLFRDHVGVKPLHYVRLGGGIAFASSATPLVNLTERRLDRRALVSYLADGYVSTLRPLIRGVESVPPGSSLTWTSPEATPKARRWFNERVDPGGSVRSTVVEAVSSEIPSEHPVVTALSGGVDSTLVTLLAAQRRPDTTALTVAYADMPSDPDSGYAERVAASHNVRHEFVRVSANDYREEILGGWRFDYPLADPNAIAFSRLCRRARELGSRVLLVGDGADELFCGYPYYGDVAGLTLGHRIASWRFTSMTDDRDRWFAARLTGQRIRRCCRPSLAHPLLAAQRRDIRRWLEPNLLAKADRFGMAEQVEVRPPFVRKAVVRAGLRLPPRRKFDPMRGVGKIALRDAFADILPTYVLERPKVGFPSPLTPWLRGPLGQYIRHEMTHSLDEWDIAEEHRLWNLHLSGQEDWAQQLWRLAVLRSWLERISSPSGESGWAPTRSPAEPGFTC